MSIKITVTHEIDKQRISDLLVTAFEGGSNYWIEGLGYTEPKAITWTPAEKKSPKYAYYPLNPGGAVAVDGQGKNRRYLVYSCIVDGLQLMANEHPTDFEDFRRGDEDAHTADLFLQLCLFGKVLYD